MLISFWTSCFSFMVTPLICLNTLSHWSTRDLALSCVHILVCRWFLLMMKVDFGGVEHVSQSPRQSNRSNEYTWTSNALALFIKSVTFLMSKFLLSFVFLWVWKAAITHSMNDAGSLMSVQFLRCAKIMGKKVMDGLIFASLLDATLRRRRSDRG